MVVIDMVICKAKVVKNEIVTGGDYHPHPIEIWTTFEIDELKIEAFMGLPRVDSEVGKIYDVNFKFMAYDLHQINIEDKMLKQISTFPMDPLYVVTGQVLEHDPDKGRTVVDCGILLECDTSGKLLRFWRNKIKAGDWVYLMGKMFGEIVEDNDSGEDKE